MQFTGAEGSCSRSFFCSQTLPILRSRALHTLEFGLTWETAQPVEVVASICFHVDPVSKLPLSSCTRRESLQQLVPGRNCCVPVLSDRLDMMCMWRPLKNFPTTAVQIRKQAAQLRHCAPVGSAFGSDEKEGVENLAPLQASKIRLSSLFYKSHDRLKSRSLKEVQHLLLPVLMSSRQRSDQELDCKALFWHGTSTIAGYSMSGSVFVVKVELVYAAESSTPELDISLQSSCAQDLPLLRECIMQRLNNSSGAQAVSDAGW